MFSSKSVVERLGMHPAMNIYYPIIIISRSNATSRDPRVIDSYRQARASNSTIPSHSISSLFIRRTKERNVKDPRKLFQHVSPLHIRARREKQQNRTRTCRVRGRRTIQGDMRVRSSPLSTLNDDETKRVLAVLERDFNLRRNESKRIE